MTTFPNNLSQGNKRNGKLEPFWRTQPVRNREQEQFLNEFYRSEGKTRGGIEEQAKAILARPGALSSTGMIDPRVVSKEEARTIARYRATQPQEETPIQRARPREWWEPAVHTADAFYQEISLPFAGSVAAVASPSVREAYNEARAEGKPISVAFREGWEKGLVRTPSMTVSLPGKGISFGDKSIDDIQLGLKGAGEIILDPLNLLPGIGFGRQIGTGVRAAAGAAKGATAKGMALGLKGLDVVSPARAAYGAGPIPPDKIVSDLPIRIKDKWAESVDNPKQRNSRRAEADIRHLEDEGYDVSNIESQLDEYRDMERSDFGDAEEFSDARTEAWELFVESLDEAVEEMEQFIEEAAEEAAEAASEAASEAAKAAAKVPAPIVGAGGRSVDETLEELNRIGREANAEHARLIEKQKEYGGSVSLDETSDPIQSEGFKDAIPQIMGKMVRGQELTPDELFVWNKYKQQLDAPTNRAEQLRKQQIDIVEEAQAAAKAADKEVSGLPIEIQEKWKAVDSETGRKDSWDSGKGTKIVKEVRKDLKLLQAEGYDVTETERYIEAFLDEGAIRRISDNPTGRKNKSDYLDEKWERWSAIVESLGGFIKQMEDFDDAARLRDVSDVIPGGTPVVAPVVREAGVERTEAVIRKELALAERREHRARGKIQGTTDPERPETHSLDYPPGDPGYWQTYNRANSDVMRLMKELEDAQLVRQRMEYKAPDPIVAKEPWQMTKAEFDESTDTVFHGTKAEFDRFKLTDDVANQTDPGLVGRGVYFTPTKQQAEEFAKNPLYGRGDVPRVISARVKLNNPAIIEDGILPDGRTLSEAHPRGITKDSAKAVQKVLKDAGYDGAIFRLSGETTQVVAFDTTAIKTHRELVEQAIAEGNRVPDEVLRGYPNLAPSKAPAPIVAKAAPDVIPGAPARTPIEEAIERGGGIDDATRQADNLRKQGQNKIERANNILRISEELRAQEAPSFRKLSVKEQTRREDALETLTFRTFEDGRVGSVGLLSPRPAADKIRLLTVEYEKIYKQGQQQLRKADELIETATADAIERGTKADTIVGKATDDVSITPGEGVPPPGGIIPEGVGVGDEAPRPWPLSREDVQKWVKYLEEQKWAQGNTEAIMLRAQQLARAEALEAVQEAPGRVRQAQQVVRSIQDEEDLKVLLATREEQHLLRQQAALDLRKKQIKTAQEQRDLAVQQREVRERLEAGQKKMELEVTRRDPRTGKIVEGRAPRKVRQEQIRKEAATQQAAREARQPPKSKPRDALAALEEALREEPKGSLLSRIIGINLREKIYDRNFAISQIGRAVGIRGFIEGKGTALAAKAHKLAQIVPGSLGAAEDIIRRVYAPVMNRVGRKDWKILEQYMILRRSADLKLRKVDTRYPFQEMDVPGGLSGAEVKTALNALENAPGMTPERWAVITQGAEDLWRLNREQILQPMRDEGIISAEAYQNIIRENQHYIPFKRDRFTQWVERSYVTPEANLSTTGLQAMTPMGSEAKLAANPLLHMVNDPVKVQGMIFRNRAARSIVEALEELQEQTGEVLARREGEKTLVDGREHIFKPEISNEEDIISFFDDGVLQRVQVPKIYAEVAKGLSSEPDNILLSIARKINAPIRYGATTYNPFFLPVNILRDAMSAAFREKLIPFGPDYIKGLWSVIRRSADFEEAARSGALLSGVVEDMSKGRGVRSTLGGLSVPSNPWEAATFPFRLMEELNIIFERGVRVGTFRKLRGEGIDALEAAVRSRDATVDFAKAGNVGRVINQVIPFSNAGIQGFANMTRTIWQNPQRVAAFGSIFSSAAISARLWNTQFDTHELIPDYEYTRNYVVMLGEGIRKDETKFPIYIKIPKGEIAAMLTFPAEAFMHLARKEDDRSIAETYLDTGLEALRASTPVGEIPLLSEEGIPMPPLLQTGVGLQTNVQMFTGAPIVPMGEEQKPPEQQVGPKTSTTATAIGQQFKISPRKLDYALRDIAGGTGQSALWMLDTALKAVGIDPEPPGALAADAELKPEGVEEVAQTPLRRFIGTRDTQIERMGYEAFDKAVIDTNRKLSTLPGPDIYGVSLGKVSSELMGGRIELTPNQRATYQRILGVYAYENVKKIITSSSYRGKPADVKERYLKQMVSNARERARNKIVSIVMRDQQQTPATAGVR